MKIEIEIYKVSEKQPPVDQFILVWTERFDWTQGKLNEDGSWWTLDDLSAYEEIIYWCELPIIKQ